LHVETESKKPTLKNEIPSDGRKVVGLAVINDKLFVLRHPSEEKIQVYDTEQFSELEAVHVVCLKDDDWPWYNTLTACRENNCLFVCDRSKVYKVDLSKSPVDVMKWRVVGGPTGLSVNDACNVLVTCCSANEIREYEQTQSQFKLVRTIKLPESEVTSPFHAVQLTDSRFIVSHWGPVNDVSIITTNKQNELGQVTASYINIKSTTRVYIPMYVTVVNDLFLLADENNDRLVVLDNSSDDTKALKRAQILILPINNNNGGPLRGPRCLYFDESCSRLYVGEYGEKRVLIFDDVRCELNP